MQREKMSAKKVRAEKFLDFGNAFRVIEILRRVARVLSVKKKKPGSFFRFDQANQQFLQMRVRSAIITQSHFNESFFVERNGKRSDEFFDIFSHKIYESTE